MKRLLGVLLAFSVLLNVILLLRGAPPPPPSVPRPPVVQEKIVVVESQAPSAPRPEPVPPPAPEPRPRPRPKPEPAPPVAPATGVMLTALPANVQAGETIQVTWSVYSGQAGPNDWIGLYPVGADAQSHQVWKYAGTGTQGTVAFEAPGTPGAYEFRFLLDNGYTVAAASHPVTVIGGGASSVQLAVYPASTTPGSPLTLVWTVVSGKRTKSDWIGLYPAGAAGNNTSYVAWQYVGEGIQGTLTFAAPKEPGTYEFRFLPNNGYASLASSNPVTVLR